MLKICSAVQTNRHVQNPENAASRATICNKPRSRRRSAVGVQFYESAGQPDQACGDMPKVSGRNQNMCHIVKMKLNCNIFYKITHEITI